MSVRVRVTLDGGFQSLFDFNTAEEAILWARARVEVGDAVRCDIKMHDNADYLFSISPSGFGNADSDPTTRGRSPRNGETMDYERKQETATRLAYEVFHLVSQPSLGVDTSILIRAIFADLKAESATREQIVALWDEADRFSDQGGEDMLAQSVKYSQQVAGA